MNHTDPNQLSLEIILSRVDSYEFIFLGCTFGMGSLQIMFVLSGCYLLYRFDSCKFV